MNEKNQSTTIALARSLIRQPSVTPSDHGCQELLLERLSPLGFTAERLAYSEVTNFWARRGSSGPLFAFAGHTDVVPTGPEDHWSVPPFAGVVRDGKLWGRGAADMKGSLAAMVTACERFVNAHPEHRGSIAFLVTSDEEGPAENGTRRVIERLQARGERPDWCLVGEPSSEKCLGDVIKNGRRGSLNGRLTVFGRQGHVAYPHLADNPIHRASVLITALANHSWGDGDAQFPASNLQISNIRGGTGAPNVIPGVVEIDLNVRFSPTLTVERISTVIQELCEQHGARHALEWMSVADPFLTADAELVKAAGTAIHAVTGVTPTLSTAGGTSDGRFIAKTGAQVVELGPVNTTIHQIDEHVTTDELDQLSAIYERVLVKLLT